MPDYGAWVQPIGVVGLVLFILVTGARGSVWIFTSVRNDERKFAQERLDEMRDDRNEWKAQALKGLDNNGLLAAQNEKLTEVVEKLTAVVSAKDSP